MTALTTESPRAHGARGDSLRARRKKHSPLEQQRRRMFWPFAAPALLVYTVIFLVPIGYAAWTSLYKWDGMGPKRWRGWKNYQILFDDPYFRSSLTNTLKILFIGGGCTFAIAFALTLVLREMTGRLFARSVIFFPCLVNAMVFGILAGFLFSPDGPVNQILHGIGISTPPKWLSTDNLLPMIIGTLIWTATGYYTAIIMAAVDQIPTYLYEAAELDGCNAFQRFRHVTLPMAWDVISVCAVLWTVSSVKIFELILVYGGSNSGAAPPAASWNTAMYVYEEAFPPQSTPELGMATAAAIVSLVMVALFTVILRRIMRRAAVEY
ncbi:carbohydrate ABC transporter permease [Catenulispora rubra]|uniref:carbohydrate ABC transporter permease n=1 Tax=Catenulispora rubra TaxID=280293 RepID=UPI001891F627|nr:sugar ABC transporter permease [Catenulispora rubra]